MTDKALRIWVERLARNDVRIEGLTTLFLALRDRCDGRETVREIGDFVAHRSERNKGILTRSVRDFFVTMRFASQYSLAGKTATLDNLPKNIIDVLWASLRQVDAKWLKKKTGMTSSRASAVLKSIGRRLILDDTGRLCLAWPENDDLTLIQPLTSVIVSKPAFTEQKLFDEFSATLESNQLLRKQERYLLEPLSGTLALYAASCMHGCTIDLGDGTSAQLRLLTNGDGLIEVGAKAGVDVDHIEAGRSVNIMFPIFQTATRASDRCDPAILANGWPDHVELNASGTLSEMD
jgi:hypothetical protein